MATHPLTVDRVRAAAALVEPHIRRTPVLTSGEIDRRADAQVFMKAEHLQRSGSFKARGAHHKLLCLSDDERAAGVVAASSGNHATALACAGRRLGVAVEVYMPHDAPQLKQRATRGYGATIHFFDRHTDSRDELIAAHVERTGATVVPPYDDHDVMAGQGTVALELHDEVEVDTFVAPMSGGGLMAGCAVATAALRPGCRIVGVEPAGADDTFRSFAAGERITIDGADTIADGLALTVPGLLTFPINHDLVDEVVTVSDDEIAAAMLLLFERTKQVVEPSGAASLAAVLAGRVSGGRVAVVLSGGNIEIQRFASVTDGV
jgi:threonine dehydratase